MSAVQPYTGPWQEGKAGGSIVTVYAVPGCGPLDEETRAYYGGYLIAESITPANRRRILACVNACQGIPTAQLELAASWGDIIKAAVVSVPTHTGDATCTTPLPTATSAR